MKETFDFKTAAIVCALFIASAFMGRFGIIMLAMATLGFTIMEFYNTFLINKDKEL
jgi:hypothetical protein